MNPVTFNDLPNEIIMAIFEHLNNHDATMFCLTNRRLFGFINIIAPISSSIKRILVCPVGIINKDLNDLNRSIVTNINNNDMIALSSVPSISNILPIIKNIPVQTLLMSKKYTK